MSDSKSGSGGISFLGLLTIAFIVLKLCKVIDWSWGWVTCPVWGPMVLALICVPFRVISKLRQAKKKIEAAPKDSTEIKSKWQQRMEEMHKKQKADVN